MMVTNQVKYVLRSYSKGALVGWDYIIMESKKKKQSL